MYPSETHWSAPILPRANDGVKCYGQDPAWFASHRASLGRAACPKRAPSACDRSLERRNPRFCPESV